MALKVRPLDEHDVEPVMEMARAMHAESPRFIVNKFSERKARQIVEYFATGPNGGAFVILDDERYVGMIGGVPVEHFFSEDKYASDLVVYVAPDARGGSAALRLIRAFEQWAFKEQGVGEVLLGVSTQIEAERTVRVYERLGYKLTSYTLIKTRAQWENNNVQS